MEQYSGMGRKKVPGVGTVWEDLETLVHVREAGP